MRFATLAAVTVAPALAAVAEPGSPAGDGLRNYHLHLALPPALAGVIRPGESATATAPLLSRPRIPAQVLTATGSQAVLRLQFPARLIEYLTLRISFPHLSVAGVAAPIESIYAPDGRRAWIFVLREGKLRRIGVEAVGEELQTGRVLLVGDVRAGEKVAVERIDALLDGDRAEERR
ncbi:MAG: hypothetical protein K1X75_16060 [Leptospirales bacterium]|nr:hypothetical protein [Leptospirales bacterium]